MYKSCHESRRNYTFVTLKATKISKRCVFVLVTCPWRLPEEWPEAVVWPWLVLQLSTVLALTQLGIRQSDWRRAGIRSTTLHIVVELKLNHVSKRGHWGWGMYSTAWYNPHGPTSRGVWDHRSRYEDISQRFSMFIFFQYGYSELLVVADSIIWCIYGKWCIDYFWKHEKNVVFHFNQQNTTGKSIVVMYCHENPE